LRMFLNDNNRQFYVLTIIVSILVFFGLIILLASTSFMGMVSYGDTFYFVKKQSLYLLTGITVLIFVSQVDYKIWYKFAWPFYLFTIFLLLAIYIPGVGKEAGGARRWIVAGAFSLQPSDLARLGVVILLARLFSNRKDSSGKIYYLLAAIISGIPALIIGMQPDFGTAIHLILVTLLIMVLAGMPFYYIGGLFVFLLPFFKTLVLDVPYRWSRIRAFLDPYEYRYEAAYQLVASYKAFLAGGIWGKGLGEGLRRHNLQARHTDFILAVIAEDIGFWGVVLTLILFFSMGVYVLYNLKKISDTFSLFLGTGIILLFMLQAIINIAVSMGLMPVTGINLPLISYGGTSLVTYMLMFGIVLNILKNDQTIAVLSERKFK